MALCIWVAATDEIHFKKHGLPLLDGRISTTAAATLAVMLDDAAAVDADLELAAVPLRRFPVL